MQVGDEPHWTFAFLAEEFGVWLAATRGDTPVDGAGVVAGSVEAHLLEFEATAALRAAMSALQAGERGPMRVQAQSVRGAAQREQFRQVRVQRSGHGAGT